MEENGDLDELDDGVGQLGYPVGDEAEQEAALGALIDGRNVSFVLALAGGLILPTRGRRTGCAVAHDHMARS